ncbi:Rieske (2Fe-2S) protein [Microbispora hainanensis]|uniref:Cytochrome bc1 complex Rieske iron-sulfur subunit n=1 Tax=Microbispora hainanensis TaxID=568844 RepID=A0ABZ1SXJ3_9ACTN|nr:MULTISPECIES: Rieske (2Fe-2S) protein [Microbispora]NJP29492.1 Rieske (2Fe-2S) protein [Microbispora sp. CL1-1]TQS05053.1 Rieske (2Fe-2S) protein [Microbispora sp. SCL1-1]
MTDTTRRAVIFGAGGAGLAVALSACGASGDTTASADQGGAQDGQDQAAQGGGELAKTSDIPEGGGKVFKDQDVVVTQPAAGEFKAFSATCTHQGCPVASVSNNEIVCPCHGSRFSAKDGSVTNGPAARPLAERKITVSGDSITLA